jgi:hypothetical protein
MSKSSSPRDQITVTIKQDPKLVKLLEETRQLGTVNISGIIRQVLSEHLPEAIKRAGQRN